MRLLSTAPAKLILSGEHAVVYGQPALSTAINLPTECRLDLQPQTPHLTIQLVDYQLTKQWLFEQAWLEAENIHMRFQHYQNQSGTIKDVCQTPFDLILLTLFHFNKIHPLTLDRLSIHLQSKSWRSRGLGSSAAVITSLLMGLFKAHKIENLDLLRQLAITIESYQHGQSSGIDPSTLLSTGLIRYQQGQPIQSLAKIKNSFWLIDTGKPSSQTGECVEQVKIRHAQDHLLWQDFADCTNQMQQALVENNPEMITNMLDHNQKLLHHIGVVPKKIMQFTHQLNQLEMATKICGAGSIVGDAAGVMLAYSPHMFTEHHQHLLDQLCQQHGYRLQSVITADYPTHCEPMSHD